MGTQLPLQKGAQPPIFSPCLLWPNGRPSHLLLSQVPLLKGAQPPIFSPYLLWPNGSMDQDATWYGGKSRPKRHCVRWGPSSPSPNRGHNPQFSVHVYCAKRALWIKMPPGVVVGLDPSDIMLYEGPTSPSPKERAQPPIFGPCLLSPNGWMDEDATWYEDRARPRPHCVTWDPAPLPKRGTAPPPISGPCL